MVVFNIHEIFNAQIVTELFLLFIVGVFLTYAYQALKVYILFQEIRNATEDKYTLTVLEKTKLASIAKAYINTICIDITGKKQTNTLASELFSDFSACSAYNINLRQLDTASGTLVGLGLLGTFLGLTLGIKGFDSSSTQQIYNSIQVLLGGMGTAFITSLLGMALSLVYTILDKYVRNKLSKQLYSMNQKLDSEYYIDDRTLDDLNEQALAKSMSESMREAVRSEVQKILNTLNEKLAYTNGSGETITVGNAIREILTENQEQSKALKSFSTDLAIELNNGFDEALSRQMQQKILPLMENVDITTKAIVEHIDKMADQVASPATDMIQQVVEELKNSMTALMKDFTAGLSRSATNELEELAHQLSAAAKSMSDFPSHMSQITSTLQATIGEVKLAISEISNTSANTNSQTMQRMQEQITFATGAISESIAQVKEVMTGITNSSQAKSEQMIISLAEASDKMAAFLTSTISSISSTIQQQLIGITDDISSKQTGLISLQEETTEQTRNLLATFNASIEKMERINESVSGTIDSIQQAQGQISGSTVHLQSITSDMKTASQIFNQNQNDYLIKAEEMQMKNSQGINAVTELLKNSGELSQDYAQQFMVIQEGLGNVFQELQRGLSEYSRTVEESTKSYLSQYSTSLTNTADALSSTIQQLYEVVETLVETLNNKKK